jgi:hypothetical protein
MTDPWALTYEDDTAAPTDERLAYELLCGVDVRLPNRRLGKSNTSTPGSQAKRAPLGRLGKAYLTPGSQPEQAARAALARLFRQGSPFPEFIRETLAALFDPASATVPAGRRIDFVQLKKGQNRPEAGLEVAMHVWQWLWPDDGKKEAAVESAMQEFGLSRRQVFAILKKHANSLPELSR